MIKNKSQQAANVSASPANIAPLTTTGAWPSAHKVDALVIGAGIIGMTTALELQKQGRQVVVIDRLAEVGMGCSYGNAGWITPCFAMPLPQPGMFWKSIGWLLNPDSPLYIKPEPSWLLMRWMTSFLFAMNQKRLLESVAVLTDISKYSLEFYKQLSLSAPQTFGFEQKGLLLVSANQNGLAAAENEMKLMGDRGIPGRRLSGEETLALEPSLRSIVKGGVYFPTEAHAEPLATVRAVADEFQRLGGRILPRTEVYDFEMSGDRIAKVMTTRGAFNAETVVLSMGTWSRVIARRLQVSVPLLGGKGYSMITTSFETKPVHPVMIVERKIAITPRADSVRMAGTMEIVDQDEGITSRRVNAIINGTKEYMKTSPEVEVSEVWRGLRPCTPDGVPMVGYSKKWSNLFYNVGHQMLGLQSAPGSARLAADLVMRRSTYTDARPFRPERFE
jgi:D-amino-acid dehydrogenase